MHALIQRVSQASVTIDGEIVGEIGSGLLILVCAMKGDGETAPETLARKVAKLRVFRDEDGRMNRSLLDTGGAALVVSQFTLAADARSGNRPGFSSAAPPEEGERAYERFAAALQEQGPRVATGRFGAEMQVALVNDGPVTICLSA